MRSYFSKIYGNALTKQRIGSAIADGTLAHAFLICGEDGSGKMTLATEISAAINCERRNTSNILPCRECNTCRRIYARGFIDVKTLTRSGDKATIGVEEIRDFRDDMFLSSTESEYKVYIIDEAEKLTVNAQNALLKVLEEPPSKVIIMLLAEATDSILTTIKSRTQYVAMERFDENALIDALKQKKQSGEITALPDEDRLRAILMSADGRIGRALELVNRKMANENKELRREILDLIRAICHKSGYAQIYRATASLPRVRSELLLSLEQIITALRDLIALKNGAEAKLLFFISREEAVDTASDISVRRLLSAYDAVLRAHELCYRNANVGNLITNLTSELKYGFCR